MANFMILLKKNLLEMVRNKKIIIFGIVFCVLSLISVVAARYLPELLKTMVESMPEEFNGMMVLVGDPTVADSYLQFISNFGQIALLLTILMFAATISKEKSKGTYDSLKMNRVKDKEIVLAHFVAEFLVVTLSYLVSVAIFVLLNILLFKQVMGVRGFVVLLYIYLLLLAALSITLLISSVCKKKNKAYLFVILGYFALSFIEVIPRINMINPLHLITLSSELMYYSSYYLTEHVVTAFTSFLISVGALVLSMNVVKNKINNRKKVINNDYSSRV